MFCGGYNGILVEYAYPFLRLKLHNLDFITAHSSLSLHKFRLCTTESEYKGYRRLPWDRHKVHHLIAGPG